MSTSGVARIGGPDLGVDARLLEMRPALEILSWGARQFAGRITLATGFGPEGCILIDMIGRHRLPIDMFTLDTGLLFPETRELWRRLEVRYDLRIRAVQPSQTVEAQAAAHGPELWNRDPDRCCGLRKVEPLRAELRNFDAWISGIRRDQTADRAVAEVLEWDWRYGVMKVNPLIRWTRHEVWRYLHEHDVPCNPLHERGYPSIGCIPCTSAVEQGEDERSGRWRGRAKTECGLHARGAISTAGAPVALLRSVSHERGAGEPTTPGNAAGGEGRTIQL